MSKNDEDGANKEKKKRKKRVNVSNEEIFELREAGYTCGQIVNIYNDRGICVSRNTIQNRYEEECAKRNKTKVDLRKIKNEEEIKERIYELKLKGMSLRKITEDFRSKGNNIAPRTVREYWKIICEEKDIKDTSVIDKKTEKGEKEPESRGRKIKFSLDTIGEEIYTLKNEGKSYGEILEHFKDKKTDISISTIRKICMQVYEQKGEKIPRAKKKSKAKKQTIENDESLEELKEILRELMVIKGECERLIGRYEDLVKRFENSRNGGSER